MATKVHMEALSPTMEEGQLVRWLKKEGDQVSEGDVLAEIETDKATMELVARGSGILGKLLLAEGGTAPVGAVIGMIGEAGEDVSSAKQTETKAPEAKQPEAKAPEAKQPEAKPAEATGSSAKQPEKEPDAKQPAAQSEAEEHQQSDGGSQTSREQGAGTDAWGRRKTAGAKPTSGEEQDTENAAAAVAASDKTGQSSGTQTGKVAASAGTAAPAAGKSAAPDKAAPAEKGAPAEGNGQPEGRVKASPLARRLAAESGVELHSVQGTGPGGRITKRDIEAAGTAAPQGAPETEAETETEAQPAAAKAGAQPAAPPAAASGADVQEVPVTQMRKAIAKRLVTSIGPVPTFYLTIEVDMTRTQEMRERLNARLKESGGKASVNDFIIRAAAEALRRHPEVNASWADTVIRRYGRVHVGVAVAIEDGLITPVIHDADRKGVAQIAAEVRELAGRAREKKLKPEEYTGATFSISNLGMFGIDEFTAIINPPESAILAVGRIEDKPVAENGEVVVRPRMRVTMSCDHRVIDGATGAKFLQTLREFLEDPLMIIA